VSGRCSCGVARGAVALTDPAVSGSLQGLREDHPGQVHHSDAIPAHSSRFSNESVASVRFVLIVTGSIQARPESIDKVLALSLAHVRRSRREPGCLLHSVHHDVEDPLRLVFLEHWADENALRAHFRVSESGAFVRDVAALAASAPEMTIYTAQAVSI
jgi:quinol monooxygenase YgiN